MHSRLVPQDRTNDISTDIATYRLNRPRDRFSERENKLENVFRCYPMLSPNVVQVEKNSVRLFLNCESVDSVGVSRPQVAAAPGSNSQNVALRKLTSSQRPPSTSVRAGPSTGRPGRASYRSSRFLGSPAGRQTTVRRRQDTGGGGGGKGGKLPVYFILFEIGFLLLLFFWHNIN